MTLALMLPGMTDPPSAAGAPPMPGLAAMPARRRMAWAAPVATLALVGGASLAALLGDGVLSEGALGMVYLVPIVAAAVWFGPLQGGLAAGLAFLCWNFLFLEPRYTLAISGAQDVVGAAVFALVALLLAGTTGGLGRSVRAARRREQGLGRLIAISRRLGAATDRGDLVQAIAEEAARLTGQPACVLLPLPPAPGDMVPEPVLRAAVPIDAEPDTALAWDAARTALGWGRATGHGTVILPEAGWQFRPMRTESGIAGLVGLRADSLVPPLDAAGEAALDALLDQAALALERATLIEERAHGAARAEAETLRTALLSSLGHDLKTPLTTIRGAIATLRGAGPALTEATRADLLATAEEETTRLARWIANILDMLRIEHGQVVPRREPVDLTEALETAVARLRRPVAIAPGPRLVAPRLDPVLLDQVLANLLDNALKFAGPAGQVRVAARREGAELAITVEDDGPGIAAADLARVFDPYFRAMRTDRVAAGSGLGLAICRGLVRAMDGRIAAESPIGPDGRGTRVTVRVPAA